MYSFMACLKVPDGGTQPPPLLEPHLTTAKLPTITFCAERSRLSREFLSTVHELLVLQNQQVQALIDGDSDFSQFDTLLHYAQEKKDRAKYEMVVPCRTAPLR